MSDSQANMAAIPPTSVSSSSSPVVAQGPPPPWTAPRHGNNVPGTNTGFSFQVQTPTLLETPTSSPPLASSAPAFGAAPPSLFGPCPPSSSSAAQFGSFGAASVCGSAPHLDTSLSSTGCSFFAPPVGASSSGWAFGSTVSPCSSTSQGFQPWQSSPFGAALPGYGVGHGAKNWCNSCFQGSQYWSGPPLASSLTPSFASHHNHHATCAPLFGSPSSPFGSNSRSLFGAVKKLETVCDDEEARIVSVSVPRFLQAGDSHEEIRWSGYQKRSKERDFGPAVKSFGVFNSIPTSSTVGTPQIIRQGGQSLDGSSKILSKFPISIQVVPPPFVPQSEIKSPTESSPLKRNIMKAPSFIDEELPRFDTPPFPNRSDLSAKSGNVVSYSFVLHQHRITIQIECPNSHCQFGEETVVVSENLVDVESCLPTFNHAEYYTEPTIQELAAREREDPGYCSRVRNFAVGRHGYGSIMFPGETDVRGLELDSIIQFNSKEVMVYMDKTNRPPVGVGLNKRAVVTLLNVKYFDKKTGEQYTDGPIVEKIKNFLMKQTCVHGAEFLSYDAIIGVWKFALKNFGHL